MSRVLSAVTALIIIFCGVVWLQTRGPPESPAMTSADNAAPVPARTLYERTAHARSSAAAHRMAVSGEADAPRTTGTAVVTLAGESQAEPPPIDVTPGFESFLTPSADLEDTDPRGLSVRGHRKLQLESRDESWSPRVESDIRRSVQDELITQGLDPHRVELALIECRTTGCEIQAIGYPEDNLTSGDLQMILPKIVHGPMAADFAPKTMAMTLISLPNRRIGYIAFLPRQRP